MSILENETIRADDFINESERNATPANDSGKCVKLESDGQLGIKFIEKWLNSFGDGSDGDVTIGVGTTTLSRDMQYSNLVVTGTLVTNGFRIFVKNTISGAGTIKWGTPNAGANSPQGSEVYGAGGAQSGSGLLKNTGGGNGGASTRVDATNGGQAYGGGITENPVACLGSTPSAGGNGGNVGAYLGGNGGQGSITAPTTTFGMFRILSTLLCDLSASVVDLKTTFDYILYRSQGSAGGGGAGNKRSTSVYAGGGGGGGASGGIVYVMARVWTGTFTIEATGANGGAGSTSTGGNCGGGGGGAGGNGGIAIIIYLTKTWTGSYVLTGGTGGAGGGGTGSGTTGIAGTNGVTGKSFELSALNLI